MKKLQNIYKLLLVVVGLMTFSSCEDFLNDIPKGQKIPQTWDDYNAFIKNTTMAYYEMEQIFNLMNDRLRSQSVLNSSQLTRVHYLWDESVDRTKINADDKNAYYSAYEQMLYWNLIIADVPSVSGCTDEQRQMLIAQAKVLRAMTYYYLTNYYADQYCEATKDKLSVPLVTSPSVESSSPQVTLERMYNFMLQDLNEAVQHLPREAETIVHPNKAAGYAMLARVYLSMSNFEEALKNAELALGENDSLYDWVKFYFDDQDRFENTLYNSTVKGDPETQNCENYIFHYGPMSMWQGVYGSAWGLPEERGDKFEPGDTRLLTHWKKRTSASLGTYYWGQHGIEPNKGGIRSAEMYYIKAECLARKGDAASIKQAMDVVNTVRKTRILPEYYQDFTASNTKEAMELIIKDKSSEYCQSQVIFCDYRRYNKEGLYPQTLKKTVNGVEYTLKPDSHLWIMPFPAGAIDNPGNGTLVQNVEK